jgi:HD-like signal output (HDOD) protein
MKETDMHMFQDRFEQKALQTGVVFPFKAKVLEYVVNLVNDPLATVARMGAVIGWNPVLARSLSAKANAVYGFPGRVQDVNLALALLGPRVIRDTMKRLIANGATRHIVNSFEYCDSLWDHSLTCALVAKAVAAELGVVDPDRAFVAGLVHDIGLLFLGDDLPSPESEVQPEWAPALDARYLPRPVPLSLHEEAGSWMVDRWETLSPEIQDAVRHHHEPERARQHPLLAAVVHVADVVCHRLFGGPMGRESVVPFSTEALALLGLRENAAAEEPLSTASLQASVLRRAPALKLKVEVLKQNLVDMYEELAERERFVLAMHYYEGIPINGIAGVLGESEEDVVELHARAITHLQRGLLDIGELT